MPTKPYSEYGQWLLERLESLPRRSFSLPRRAIRTRVLADAGVRQVLALDGKAERVR
jgi:hypothetical protein